MIRSGIPLVLYQNIIMVFIRIGSFQVNPLSKNTLCIYLEMALKIFYIIVSFFVWVLAYLDLHLMEQMQCGEVL